MFERCSPRLVPVILTSFVMALPLAAAPGIALGQERVVCNPRLNAVSTRDQAMDIFDVGLAGMQLTDEEINLLVAAQRERACGINRAVQVERSNNVPNPQVYRAGY